MVIIGLLLIALVCLVLGLAMQTAAWLVASLIATAGAGFLLYKLRGAIAAPKPAVPAEGSEAAGAAPSSTRDAASPDEAGEAEPAGDASPPSDIAAEPIDVDADADDVWVIDGRPRYHLGDCAIIKGQDAEAISFEQATEDGFMPCSLCEPHAARTS